MKPFTIYIALFAILLSNSRVLGQCQEIQFQPTCTTPSDSVPRCSTWANACGSGWTKSHGTPQLKPYTYTDPKTGLLLTGYYAYMWSNHMGVSGGLIGEGMFTNFSFTPNQTMEFTVRVLLQGQQGTLYFYAASGLTRGNAHNCGDPIPSVTQKQFIGQVTTINNAWTDYKFEFTPNNSSYTQLWMYPASTSTTPSDQINANVMTIQACPTCGGTVTYNTGTVPTGPTISGDIYAGSSSGTGGSGVVTVQSTQTTRLVARDGVYLTPDFNATLSGSGSFSAEVYPCGSYVPTDVNAVNYDSVRVFVIDTVESAGTAPSSGNLQAIGNSLTINRNGSGASEQKISVFPTVSKGIVNITGGSQKLNNADLIIFDEAGRIVYKRHNEGDRSISLDLSGLNNGLYFLQIRNALANTVQKITISK